MTNSNDLSMNNSVEESSVEVFSFGDAEGVLDRREVLDYLESWRNGRWYEPPIAPQSLARTLNVSGHHRSAISVKLNLLVKTFVPSTLLSRAEFRSFALDYLVMGNGYVERINNIMGRPIALKSALALNMRRGVEEGAYFFVTRHNDVHEFTKGSIFQLRENDVSQEIYGLPEYISCLQSAFLNEASTLFRRRYYINGAHAGFILYVSEAMSVKDNQDIKDQLKKSKGVGNFKNMFLNIPNGKKDGIQIMPISEVAAKDEFLGIKNTTRDDILAAHRVPPQLIGVIPTNSGGFGDVEKAAVVFFRNEIEPLQMKLMEVNDWIGAPVISFGPYMGEEISSAA